MRKYRFDLNVSSYNHIYLIFICRLKYFISQRTNLYMGIKILKATNSSGEGTKYMSTYFKILM